MNVMGWAKRSSDQCCDWGEHGHASLATDKQCFVVAENSDLGLDRWIDDLQPMFQTR
jgi:hypothetical protein